MRSRFRNRNNYSFNMAAFAAVVVAAAGFGRQAIGADPTVDATNWGSVTAPVFGSSETGSFAGAELFAGPMKFGANYFQGVLPSGKIVKPAGASLQIGMNPLGMALTPDGKYLITTNDDERDGDQISLQNPVNHGGYSLSVIDTGSMQVVSQIASGPVFIGLQVTGTGPYTVWASGGPSNSIKLFTVSTTGTVSAGTPASIAIAPILPSTAGYVSNYTPDAVFTTADASGNKPAIPSGFDPKNGAHTTFPAGSALSPDGKYLYVACNGDNSLAVIDTTAQKVVQQIPVGLFPYSVSVSRDGTWIQVSNWGISEYKFKTPVYDARTGALTSIAPTGQNQPDGFYIAPTSTTGSNPKTSSISLISAPGGDATRAALVGSIYEGMTLDALQQVGDTHPSATAIVRRGPVEVMYTTKSNSDSLGLVLLANSRKLADFDLSPLAITLQDGHKIHGTYPNAIVVSPDNRRVFVAESGINSIAVLDTTSPAQPRLLGRIPTGWYPTGLSISADGHSLYVVNAKGIGEDINPKADLTAAFHPTGLESFNDGNFIFGTVQKIDLNAIHLDNGTTLGYSYAVNAPADTSVVPVGGAPSGKIKHVVFILHENKTFDSMVGNQAAHFGPFASTTFNKADGSVDPEVQFTGVSLNTQLLATTFAAAANYYSDSEESDAGHQFSASGTASDYTEKTLLVKGGRGLLVNKNFETEDYPEGGYIFNNAARHSISFKDYGAMVRIEGTDTGASTPTTLNDLPSGNAGYPALLADKVTITNPLMNLGDVSTKTSGLGQSYFLALPILATLGDNNANGEPRLDRNYPGYNFNISDQRRALEFIGDFDRMVAAGKLPEYLYIYQPNDHTGGVQAPNKPAVGGATALQQVADGDVGLGMVVQHLMKSPIYYNSATGEGTAIFITYDDSQSSLDHIHPHRTPLIVVSPYARPGYVAKRHYSTASVVKTEELLMGLPPNNYGDLFATDLRDLFQPTYNGISADPLNFNRVASYRPSPEGKKIWALVKNLDTSAPDRDSQRLGQLTRLSMKADQLHANAVQRHHLGSAPYKAVQAHLYQSAVNVIRSSTARDADG